MKAVVVIPARYASTRLPGKPLLKQTGKYLIQHVYEQAALGPAHLRRHYRYRRFKNSGCCRALNATVVMTRRDHATGTDRVAEVAGQLDAEIIINLQGDEPLIDPAAVDLLVEMLATDPDAKVATLAIPITNAETWHDPNCVKVVCDEQGRAL